MAKKAARKAGPKLSNKDIQQKLLEANFRIMETVRMRVDEVVEDPKTAELLKPWYPYGCKRPCFHDQYLPSFNMPHVHLVDCAPDGVTQIQECARAGRITHVIHVAFFQTWSATASS